MLLGCSHGYAGGDAREQHAAGHLLRRRHQPARIVAIVFDTPQRDRQAATDGVQHRPGWNR